MLAERAADKVRFCVSSTAASGLPSTKSSACIAENGRVGRATAYSSPIGTHFVQQATSKSASQ
jgi:hypothetical protein